MLSIAEYTHPTTNYSFLYLTSLYVQMVPGLEGSIMDCYIIENFLASDWRKLYHVQGGQVTILHVTQLPG